MVACSTNHLPRNVVALHSISSYLGLTHAINSNVGKSLSMQYRMKSFYFKWVSLTFLGVEPNPGFWPETPTGLCWPWSWHHDGNTTQTLHRSAPLLCLKCCSLTSYWGHQQLCHSPVGVPTASCCRNGLVRILEILSCLTCSTVI